MDHDVFISYSTKDLTAADAALALLEAAGVHCWIAHRDMNPGEGWAEGIVRGIRLSRVMLLILSANANESRQVRREVERAASNGLSILPLRIDNSALEPSLGYFLGDLHWMDASTPPFEQHRERLLAAVKGLLGASEATTGAGHLAEQKAAIPNFPRSSLGEAAEASQGKPQPEPEASLIGNAVSPNIVAEPSQQRVEEEWEPKTKPERHTKAKAKQYFAPQVTGLRGLNISWLVIKEFGAVAYAARVPTLVVGLIVFLLARTEPAQDMLAEAVTDAFNLTLGTAPDGIVPESRMRWLAILASLSVLAFTAWYWARVVLMFHRAMPDLADNQEGGYRAAWRPHIVMWWPRLVGFMVFFGCAWGLKEVSDQYERLGAEAGPLVWAAAVVLVLGLVFLAFLAGRRYLLAGGREAFDAPWALNGAPDARAPFVRLADIAGNRTVALARRVGNIFLASTIVLTVGLMGWAWASPVTLGDFFGGLAIALLAGAVAIPLFSVLTICTATTRFPWFGVVALLVVFLPALNGWLSDRIDNHDVRSVDPGKPVPPRWTIDEALKAWLAERRAASPAQERPPFIVVAAEGGASRAGYWTALALGEMVRQDPDVRDSIFAISSVSGGSVGAVLMRALIDLDRVQESELGWKNADDRVVCDSGESAPQPYLSCLRVFMRRDFLAAAFSGMFFTDLMQRLWPAAWGTFPDRAETLERSWESSWDEIIATLKLPQGADAERLKALQEKATGLFAKGFAGAWAKGAQAFGKGDAIKPYPVLLLNGTAVETGRRVITSTVETLTPAFSTTTRKEGQPAAVTLPCVAILTAYGRDDVAVRKKRAEECRIWEAPAVHDPFEILPGDMPVSTAINMSARFPIVEPAGGIIDKKTGKRAYHVVDGGIYENFGAQTVKDLLHFVLVARETKVRPLVVLISTDHELDGVRQVTAAYGGTDDRAGDKADGDPLPPVERAMKLGCKATREAERDGVPLCDATLMRSANEVLGDPVALYRTRSGRGESGILGLREQLVQLGYVDESFFHFRQCMNGDLRPASMTWYVSPISQRFMDELLPSVNMPDRAQRSPKLSFVDWMKLAPPTSTAQSAFDDPCQNHAELKRLLNRHERIANGKRQ